MLPLLLWGSCLPLNVTGIAHDCTIVLQVLHRPVVVNSELSQTGKKYLNLPVDLHPTITYDLKIWEVPKNMKSQMQSTIMSLYVGQLGFALDIQ